MKLIVIYYRDDISRQPPHCLVLLDNLYNNELFLKTRQWGGKSGLHRAGSPVYAGYYGRYSMGRKVPQKIYRPAPKSYKCLI